MNRTPLFLILGATLSVGLVLAGVLGVGTAGASVVSGDRNALREDLDSRIPLLLERHGIPGASVAAVHDGKLDWAEGYGTADGVSGIPVNANTVFQVGSLSKTVSAWGAMRLVEDGLVELDTPVQSYVTRWNLPPSGFDESGVTLRRILSHTAGLSLGGYNGFEPEAQRQTLEESLTFASDSGVGLTVKDEPGASWSYSGGGYTLLELMVEEVTGLSFIEYMDQTILRPLGMPDSSFDWPANLEDRTASPHDTGGQPLPNYAFTARAAAGLYSTAPDLAGMLAATSAGDDASIVLGPESVADMLTPALNAVTSGSGNYQVKYGLGYFLQSVGSGETSLMAYHGGANRGWRAEFWVIPADGEGLVVLTNSDNGGALLADVNCVWVEWATDSGWCQGFQGHRVSLAAGAAGMMLTTVWFGVYRRRQNSAIR